MNILEKDNKFSLTKVLLLFYIFASGNALFPLLSKQWKYTLENDRLTQHLLGILTMLSFVIIISNGQFSNQRIFVYTFIAYIWFIISTKMDLQFNIIIYGSLLFLYLYMNNNDIEEKRLIENEFLDEYEKKEKIMEKNKKIFYYSIGIGIMTLFCSYIYSNRKEEQYGGGYSVLNFLMY